MRKFLLATTALVAFAGAAQAAESPIQVTLGGSVDFRAALMNESTKDVASTSKSRRGDFQTEYQITIAAEGKTNNGIEYGALVNLDNDPDRNTTQAAVMDMAYIWMSGSFGKVLMGDEHGASNLAVYAPTIGEDQIDGSYMDFTTASRLADIEPLYVDAAENATKVTFFTPRVGNENHKLQLGVSFAPNDTTVSNARQGSTVTNYDAANGYKNVIEATAQYTGQFDAVSVVASPILIVADGQGAKTVANSATRDYTLWGFGTQAAYAGFTVGASYVDAGHANTAMGQDRYQGVWTYGLKYEFDKIEVAVNYLTGKGYYTLGGARRYVDSYEAFGLGATYTWFPGMRSAADAVLYNQNRADTGHNNIGHVLMLSQKMSF